MFPLLFGTQPKGLSPSCCLPSIFEGWLYKTCGRAWFLYPWLGGFWTASNWRSWKELELKMMKNVIWWYIFDHKFRWWWGGGCLSVFVFARWFPNFGLCVLHGHNKIGNCTNIDTMIYSLKKKHVTILNSVGLCSGHLLWWSAGVCSRLAAAWWSKHNIAGPGCSSDLS